MLAQRPPSGFDKLFRACIAIADEDDTILIGRPVRISRTRKCAAHPPLHTTCTQTNKQLNMPPLLLVARRGWMRSPPHLLGGRGLHSITPIRRARAPPPPLLLHPIKRPTARITTRCYAVRGGGRPGGSSRGGGRGGGSAGPSPEQLQLLFRLAGRILGTALHFARRAGLHRSRPMLVAGLVLVPVAAGGAFLVSHLERAPLSGRLQLVFLDANQEFELGAVAGALGGICWHVYTAMIQHQAATGPSILTD